MHYLGVLRWIRRDPALRAAMPKGRIITGPHGGHPSRRTAATVTAILAIYRRSTSLRATAAEAGMPFGTLLQWTQDDRVFGAAVTSIYRQRLEDRLHRRLAARAVRQAAQAEARKAALSMARALADATAGDALAPDVPANTTDDSRYSFDADHVPRAGSGTSRRLFGGSRSPSNGLYNDRMVNSFTRICAILAVAVTLWAPVAHA